MAQADPFSDPVSGVDAPKLGASQDRPLTSIRQRLAAIGSTALFVAITAFLGRHLLAHLSTTVAHDAGDPLLTAAILKWNATHWPLTDAWWQLPFFYPTRDTMAFSEHLLGLSAIASPIYWITRDTLVTSNLATLATFPLCAMAMYALVFRLSGSVPAALVAGFAYGFAPYRISQLPHVQMLAAFWAPLALLGLHAYIDTRRARWLVLYGASWMLQSAANGYALVFFSVLVGLWTVWFVILRRDWRAFAAITAATIVAALPLAPILYEYVIVHARHGFVRSLAEMEGYSADVGAVLCAPSDLTFWGWLRVACRGEGELFPGLVVVVLWCVACGQRMARFGADTPSKGSRWLNVLVRVVIGIGLLYAVVIGSVVFVGPWRIDWGFLHVSVSSVRKPALVAIVCLVVAFLLSPFARSAVRRSSTIGFYLLATVATWLLALGPTITFMGTPSGYPGPFRWLLHLPGSNGLRVPARFWLVTVICLSVVAGLAFAELIRGRLRQRATLATFLVALGILADGWIVSIPAVPAPAPVPGEELLRRATVLQLPVDGSFRDTSALFRAVEGGWHSVNGFSGWQPNYYFALVFASRAESNEVLMPFQRMGEVRVLVDGDAPRQLALIQQYPGATLVAQNASFSQYRLPALDIEDPQVAGTRLRIRDVRSECSSSYAHVANDGNEETLWLCSLTDERQPLIVDLGEVTRVGAIVHSVGTQYWLYPASLSIETSEDGVAWTMARSGSVQREVIVAGLRAPGPLRVVLGFQPRHARYIRLRGRSGDPQFPWTIAELEAWSDSRGFH
jgi:F5/8 type C domain